MTVNLVLVPLIRCFTCGFYSVCGENDLSTCVVVSCMLVLVSVAATVLNFNMHDV